MRSWVKTPVPPKKLKKNKKERGKKSFLDKQKLTEIINTSSAWYEILKEVLQDDMNNTKWQNEDIRKFPNKLPKCEYTKTLAATAMW
jgi:hypothetical protein